LRILSRTRSAYDETLATAIKRKHEPQRFAGDLLKAEISEKQARSIKYQLTIAKLRRPLDDRNYEITKTLSIAPIKPKPKRADRSILI
jgi:hypothetical protein